MNIGRMPDAVLRGVIDDQHLNDMQMRNVERARMAIENMGSRWCCHAANSPSSVAKLHTLSREAVKGVMDALVYGIGITRERITPQQFYRR